MVIPNIYCYTARRGHGSGKLEHSLDKKSSVLHLGSKARRFPREITAAFLFFFFFSEETIDCLSSQCTTACWTAVRNFLVDELGRGECNLIVHAICSKHIFKVISTVRGGKRGIRQFLFHKILICMSYGFTLIHFEGFVWG